MICGAAHAHGIRELIGDARLPDEVLTTASAAALLADGAVLQEGWKQFLGRLEPTLPRAVLGGARLATMTLLRRVIGERVGRWQSTGWRIEAVPEDVLERDSSDTDWSERVAEKYAELWGGLLSGEVDAYPR